MKIEEVKTHFEEFAKNEAKAFDAMRIQNLEIQNAAYDEMHQNVDNSLHSNLGVIRLRHLLSPLVYRKYRDDDSKNIPRLVAKISEYHHPDYDQVWVVYPTPMNTSANSCNYGEAFVCIEENDGFLIIAHYIYHLNLDEVRSTYSWVKTFGRQAIDLNQLKNPIRIERYIEPVTDRAKELYNQNS